MSIGGYRRSGERAAGSDPSAIGALARLSIIGGDDAVDVEGVQQAAIDNWGRNISALTIVTPGDCFVGCGVFRQRNIAGESRSDGIDRTGGRISTSHIYQSGTRNRCSNRDLRIGRQGPA